ncbi:hypothetical protein K3172_15160 [Qipengyuania sp. 6B39]|uniref:hypothetical protein n=1 Tax=Qipengyuania proteolytica TaxID=2867239 RepID=UPI001C8AEF50|nr:hypothetical protein [Qipengyuania proteolytica]MBX7497197.1 hypothetical protein [Qipengyuania proteolytica]
MEEILRHAEMLDTIDAMAQASLDEARAEVEPSSALAQEDDDTRELVMLLTRSNTALLRKARLRTCIAGLQAVNQHISRAPDA